MAEVVLACGAGSSRSEELASVGEERGLDVVESIALSDDLGAGTDVEGVAGVGVPVVVDGVEERAAGHLWGAAGGVVDVVSGECDEIVGTCEVDGPVVVVVAGSGPGG